MQTIGELIEHEGIWLESEYADENPNMPDHQMFHYRVTLKRKSDDRTMWFYFSKGEALRDPPNVEEVLDVLASDASSYENAGDMWDWLEELGVFGSASEMRRHANAYKAIEKQTDDLKGFLGHAYETLLWHTECY